ncbi:hexameric tyrosine-coordinated heme protein [Helicobacter anatolicus]|uniref:hexameric tyrosine-coordinated heme protein n=1 Tax=Helicobacter anatolicus TaxID=2905874 RepID=UPI001E5E8A96|nr:hexameric tyrosine-coordinated heme protein [Helicobacter anatolicus]MCE3038971.1 hexameric tyrosine-coordinated heme protein [Helicobacter anatolicus]
MKKILALTLGAAFCFAAPAPAHGPNHPPAHGPNHCEALPKEALVLVPGNSLITATPEEGRKLAITLAQHTIHNIQPCLNKLKEGRGKYSNNPADLIQAAQVIAAEFATIAAANNYWKK